MRFIKRKGQTSIPHYAPDITLSAVDYHAVIPSDRRIHNAEKRIREFLSKTNPDSLCATYYDKLAEEEEQVAVACLQRQTPDHRDANTSIALKHQAELKRLLQEIQSVDAMIEQYQAEIKDLQAMYNRYNITEVTA